MYAEALFTFLLTAVCYCVFRIQRDEGKSRRLWILCGVLLALLALTRPNGIVIAGSVILLDRFSGLAQTPAEKSADTCRAGNS